jgi:hypothetical protein
MGNKDNTEDRAPDEEGHGHEKKNAHADPVRQGIIAAPTDSASP